MIGYDRNKIQFYARDAEIKKDKVEHADMDVFYWHLLSQFWAIKGGVNYVYRPANKPYLQPGIGIEGLLPFFIKTDLRTYLHNDSVKFDLSLERETHIYKRLFLDAGIRGVMATKTVPKDEIGSGLNEIEWFVSPVIVLNPRISIFAEFEQSFFYGEKQTFRQKEDEGNRENQYLVGLKILL